MDVLKLAGPFISRIDAPTPPARTDEMIVRRSSTWHTGWAHRHRGMRRDPQTRPFGSSALGCDAAQGWYFAKPMCAHDLTELLCEANPTVLQGR